jgi:hypothetical protein
MAGHPEHHTALDRLEVVDPASVQQAGDQLLALVRYLGDRPAPDTNVPDQTFFPVLGRLLHYPDGWAMPLAVVAGLCFTGTLVCGLRRKKLTWRGLGLGFLALLVGLAVSVAIAELLWLGIQALHPEYGYSAVRPHLSDDLVYAIGFIALALAVFTSAIAIARKQITSLDLAAGATAMWLPAAIAASFLVPATSYLASWGLLAGSLALTPGLLARPRRDTWASSGPGLLAGAVLTTFLWIPVIRVAYLAGFPPLSMMVGLAALWLGSMVPLLDRITGPGPWILPVAALLAGVGLVLAGHVVVGRRSPLPPANPIGYWLDADEDEAYWIAFAEKLDERQTGLLAEPQQQPYTDIFPRAPDHQVLTSAAPTLDSAGPDLKVIDDTWIDGRRVMRLRATTSLHDRLYVIVPDETRVLALTIPHNERIELAPYDETFVLRFDGMPFEGFEMDLEVAASGQARFLLVEESTGLPSFPGLATQPLPGTMTAPGEFSQSIPADFAAISRTVTFQRQLP